MYTAKQALSQWLRKRIYVTTGAIRNSFDWLLLLYVYFLFLYVVSLRIHWKMGCVRTLTLD